MAERVDMQTKNQINDQTSRANSIHLLPAQVVDQIAAGEVVDRPSHLIKELVENSIDAGATSVEVEFDHGGRSVRVTDNGGGILPSELPLALARHATSKISQADDLWNLHTFGFRGEALASIAAVSRLTLTSRVKSEATDAEVAYAIHSEFGKLGMVQPAAGNFGTTIVVEELFGNVPARLKFLKSEAAESTQIKQTLRALALSHPSVEIRVKTGGKILHLWQSAESWVTRCQNVLEQSPLYLSELEPSDTLGIGGMRVRIAFAGPHDVAKTSKAIWIFVQGRWVQDRGLQAAVQDAYRGLLMHGEFPICVVMLDVPLDEVDVNIHPTKSAVKFQDASNAFRAVHRCLRTGLEKAPWLSGENQVSARNLEAKSGARGAAVSTHFAQPRLPVLQNSAGLPPPSSDHVQAAIEYGANPFVRTLVRAKSLTMPAGVSAEGLREKNSQAMDVGVETRDSTGLARGVGDFGVEVSSSDIAGNNTHTRYQQTPKSGFWSSMHVIGQIHLTYIVAQKDQELVLVDQHAAHERVAYEKLMRQWHLGNFETQSLLFPISLQMEPEHVEALIKMVDELAKMGLEIDQVGPQAIAVRSYPALMKESAIESVLVKLAREVAERGGSFALEKKVGDIFATMACHSVVRAGQALSLAEMQSLLVQMDEFPLSSFCPHGRPVSISWSEKEIEREFGRIN